MSKPYSPQSGKHLRADGKLTGMLSFHMLPSTVIGNPTHNTWKAAFMSDTKAKETPLQQLMVYSRTLTKLCFAGG